MSNAEFARRILTLPEHQKIPALEFWRRERRPKVRFDRLPLYPKQQAIIDDPARFTVTEATTKAGKTMSHIEWLLDAGITASEGHWWWVATVADVADIAFRRTMDRLKGYIDSRGTLQKISDPVLFQKNLTRKYLTVGGATFWFKSADEPDSLFGEDVRGAVGDEVTRWKEPAWFALYTTLAATRGRAKLIGNVKGRRNFAYQLARKAEAGEPGWGYHKLTARDAVEGGILDEATVDQARRDLPEPLFRELFEAEAADDGGNPFGIDAINSCIAYESNGSPAVWGWDVAKSQDWTVGIALDEDGAVCRALRFQRPWQETIATIRQECGYTPTLVDSTGVGDPVLEALQRDGQMNFEGFKFSSPSKQQLMELLSVTIQRGEVAYPDQSDVPIVSELESFEFEYTRTGVRYSAPPGLHDDCVCALALAVWHRRNARAPGDYGITL